MRMTKWILILFYAVILIPISSRAFTVSFGQLTRDCTGSSGYSYDPNFTLGLFQYADPHLAGRTSFADQNSYVSLSTSEFSVVGNGDSSFNAVPVHQNDSDLLIQFNVDSPCNFSIEANTTQQASIPVFYWVAENSAFVGLWNEQTGSNMFICGTETGWPYPAIAGPQSGQTSGTLQPGVEYLLCADSDFYLPSSSSYTSGFAGWALMFIVSPSNIVTTTVSGYVTDSFSRIPIVGAIVQNGYLAAVSDATGYYSLSNLPPAAYTLIASATNYVAATNTVTTSSSQTNLTQNFSLTSLSGGPATITPLRVGAAQADPAPPTNINVPISPVTATWLLRSQQFMVPLGKGVVADGVTPVLFMFSVPPGTYTLTLTTANGTYANGPLIHQLYVLNDSQWSHSSIITIAPDDTGGTGTGFAYLSGLNWNDFTGVDSSINEVTATLSVNSGAKAITSTNSGIRPPPIVLVHGIADTGGTWSQDFTNALRAIVPDDFIVPISYAPGSGFNQWWPCTVDPLTDLVKDLDGILFMVENQLKRDWAFTRYDVVGHSQGGVLLRMLCQTQGSRNSSAFTSEPVVSANNLYRGRFRRVVTIGSPHNGSLLLYYISKLPLSMDVLDRLVGLAYFVAPAVEKFNPDGRQIGLINDASFPVDPRIGFHCIQSTIGGGNPISVAPWENPAFYDILHLNDLLLFGPYAGSTRGQILLPYGSDGIVDLLSQDGGIGTPQTYPFNNVAHCIGGWLFGVPTANTETTYGSLGTHLAALLSGPDNRFGSFKLPSVISEEDKKKYNAIIPSFFTLAGLIESIIPKDASTNINYALNIPTNYPPGALINWQGVVYGTNGIITNGLTLAINATNSALMTLTVDSNVVGQVVVSADYMTTNGDVVFAAPVVALLRPFAYGANLTNIEMQPSAISLQVGQTIPTRMLGDYSNGSQALLYIPPDQISYTSSNPQIASVDTNGNVTLTAQGSAAIYADHNGLSAKAIISSSTPSQPQLLFQSITDGTLSFTIFSTPGITNIAQASTNLVDWLPIATLVPTNYLTWFHDTNAITTTLMFYRVVIP